MATDPGRAYLYQQQGANSGHRRSKSGQLLPRTDSLPSQQHNSTDLRRQSSHLVAPATRAHTQIEAERNGLDGNLGRWDAAVGNIEDARVAFDVVARAIDDAVYLDEDAFNEIMPTMHFTQTIQTQQRRIRGLEAQLQDTRAQLEESRSSSQEAVQRVVELQEELDNNAVVFRMHYAELLSKDDEIQKLTAVIQALSGR